MKLVTFTRDMKPMSIGSERLLPDDVAARLEAEGAVTNLRDWPARTPSGVPLVPPPAEKPKLTLPRRQSYQTK